jgi:23S rRNA (cytosine1962-C5)-methyltransferase
MKRAIAQAIQTRRSAAVRARLGAGTDVYRLVNDEADGVPGVVIDRYDDVARVELYDDALAQRVDEIADALRDAGEAPRGVVVLVRARRARDNRLFVARGHVPAAHVVREDGARYLVRTAEPDAVGAGVFVDHREGRRLVRARARGGRVLNLFAHAGGFGVAALAGGAARVDHVDAARKCARWGAVNYALNGADPRRHRFLVDDAFKILARAARRGPGYDVIVCDPPTTAVDPKGRRFHARDRLAELAEQSARALRGGGSLLLSTNDRSVEPAHIVDAAREGVRAAGRALAALDEVPLPVDVPVGHEARTRPMRGAFARLA